MGRKKEVVSIDEDQYEITQLSATDGLAVYHLLREHLLPVLKGAISGGAVKLGETATGTEARALELILDGLAGLPSGVINDVSKRFRGSCTVRAGQLWLELDKDAIFDQHFSGRIAHWQRWMVACLKANFGDFFPRKGSSSAAPSTETP